MGKRGQSEEETLQLLQESGSGYTEVEASGSMGSVKRHFIYAKRSAPGKCSTSCGS